MTIFHCSDSGALSIAIISSGGKITVGPPATLAKKGPLDIASDGRSLALRSL